MPIGQFLLVCKVSSVEESKIVEKVPDKFLGNFIKILNFCLFDLVEEGFNIFTRNIAFLINVKQIVDRVYASITMRIAYLMLFVECFVKEFSNLCKTNL